MRSYVQCKCLTTWTNYIVTQLAIVCLYTHIEKAIT